MKQRTHTLALAAAFASIPAISIGFGLPSLGGKSSSSVNAGDIDTFVKTAKDASNLVRSSASQLALAISNKEERAKIQALVDANKKAESPEEKESTAKQLESESATTLKQIDFEKSKEVEAASKDEAQKKAIADSGYNLMLGMLKDKALADQGKGLVTSASSNPTLVSKLGGLKDAVGATGDQLSNFGNVSTNLPKLFTKVGVSVKAPTSAEEKPHETSI